MLFPRLLPTFFVSIFLLLVGTTPFAWGSPEPVTAVKDRDTAFALRFGDRFLDAYWHEYPDAAVAAGYYRVAERLKVPDAAARLSERDFLANWRAQLHAFDPSTLDDRNRTDWLLIENQLELQRWVLDEFQDWRWNPANYNVADPFAMLLNTEYAPLDARLRTVLKRLRWVPAYYAAAKESLERPTREHTQLAIRQNQGALDVFGDDLEKQIATSKLTPTERRLFTQRVAAARMAIEDYIGWLKALDERQALSGKARSFRIGGALYDRKFQYEVQSGYSALGLFQRAQQEKERLHARMAALADELWPRIFPNETKPDERLDKIGRVIAKLSEQHTTPAKFVADVKQQIPALEAWVVAHQLIALDPAKPLQVRETPSYQRGVAVAGIQAPGPYDPGAKTYYNVEPLDDKTPEQAESFLREYNDWILQILNIHEAVPGHYVQLIYSNRSPSRIKSVFGNGAMVEGWAVYGERMMLESGYGANTPEMWLMYSKWNLRTVCNTILDYGVHVLGMSEDDAKKLLTREAFQSQAEADGKWRRVQLTSVQLTSYFSGYAEIYDFREELKKAQGPDFDLKHFHEQFLSYGSAPVRVIRALMQPSAP